MLLMLLLLTAGVAGMHTLGHADAGHAVAAGHSSDVHLMQDPGCCGATAPMLLTATSGRGSPTPMTDPALMCLAILGAAALIAFALVLLARLRAVPLLAAATPSVALRPGRGPPRAPLGLTIADLSVLRN
jgi:hypothetical protein